MKYNRQYFLDLIKAHNLQYYYELREKFPAQELFYSRHRHILGDPLPLIKIKRANNTLTKTVCANLAKNYQHRSDFQKKDIGAYNCARKNGWLNEICNHMKPKINHKGGRPGVAALTRIDMVGKTYGKWTVLEQAPSASKVLKWKARCQCGHVSIVSGVNLRFGTSTKCLKCSNQISKPMLELTEYIKSLGIAVEVGSKKHGFEIDLLVDSGKFFIEYDGLIWHSSKFRATAASESARYNRFLALQIPGMRIFEDQFLQKPKLIKAMIAHRLGKLSTVTPTVVTYEIAEKPSEYREFCDKFHLDGYGRSSWAVVAKSNGAVLAFMGFRPYMSGRFKGQPELSRFCTNYEYNCYGLFGKMLKMAKKQIKKQKLGTVVVSASDNCFSQGRVYANNGFKQHGPDVPNWYYYLHSKGLRLHRAMGKKLHEPTITSEQASKYCTEKKQTESGLTAFVKWGKWEPLYKIYGWGQKLWVSNV